MTDRVGNGKSGYVSVMVGRRNGMPCMGVTSDLVKRVHQHRSDALDGIAKRYGRRASVWFEVHDRIDDAIVHGKRMKEWRRAWRLRESEAANPDWNDLFPSLM